MDAIKVIKMPQSGELCKMTLTLSSRAEDATRCRIFIGNLPSEHVTKESIANIFSQYGTYSGCSIYKNFGFVQYQDEESAQVAVQQTNGTVMFDRKLDVKIATSSRKDGSKLVGKNRNNRINMNNVRPLMSSHTVNPNLPMYPSHNIHPNPYLIGGYPPPLPPPPPPILPINHQMVRPTLPPTAHLSDQSLNCNEKFADIICTSKKQINYAEFIEFMFSKLGFYTNINIMCPNYPPGVILKRLESNNLKVIVSLNDTHESNRSVNIHLYYPKPEEHRNMPIDVAENLIKERFGIQPIPTNPAPQAHSYPNQQATFSSNLIDVSAVTDQNNHRLDPMYPTTLPYNTYHPQHRTQQNYHGPPIQGYSHIGISNSQIPSHAALSSAFNPAK